MGRVSVGSGVSVGPGRGVADLAKATERRRQRSRQRSSGGDSRRALEKRSMAASICRRGEGGRAAFGAGVGPGGVPVPPAQGGAGEAVR